MKRQPWYQNFQIIAYVVGGCTALGTAIIFLSGYLNLPKRVDAAEQEIDDLKGWAKEIQGYTRAMNQQQAQSPIAPPVQNLREWDDTTQCFWCCDYSNREMCYQQHLWYRCP